jgi:hypothetical protein
MMIIFIEYILLRDRTNLIAVFGLRNSKNVYPLNSTISLKIATYFDHPTGHHQMVQYLQVLLNWNHFN